MKINHRINRSINATVFFFIILTLNLATFPVLVHGQTASFKGRVIDEDGLGLSGVKIEAYSSPANFLYGITYTDPDGYFSINFLPIDKYNLHFSKTGYATEIISVDASFQWPDLGDVTLRKALRLSSSVLSRVANPGDLLTFPFIVANIGEEEEIVEFSITKPESWSATIKDQTGEVKKLYLSPGASTPLQLEVLIPRKYTEKGILSLTAIGKTKSTLNFTLDIKPSSNSIISCQFPGKMSTPGNAVQFQIQLKNPFGAETQFKLRVNNVPQNWTVSVKSQSGERLTEVVTLPSKESVNLIIEVKPPETAEIGKEYKLYVEVESDDGDTLGILPINVFLTEIEKEIKILTTFREVTVEAGKVVQYPITIMNLGEFNTSLLLSAESPAEWKTAFKSGTLEVAGVYLEAKSSQSLILEATPPSTVEIGTYKILVKIESEEGVVYAMTDLKATIVGSYALKIEPSTLLTSVATGESTTFTVKVTNTGNTLITGVTLNIEAPQGWESSITPIRIERLEPHESSTFSLAVKTTSDTVTGDYLLTLQGISDQVKSDSIQVRVTVTTPTSWGIIGIGIAVVAIIALILAFVKFKRR